MYQRNSNNNNRKEGNKMGKMNEMEYPIGIFGTYFQYLNRLRESGEVNMFGATPYLMTVFGINKKSASGILKFWMDNFEELQDL